QVTRRKKTQKRQGISRKIDAILCHPLLAYPCFLVIMLLVFYISFGSLGLKLQGWISRGLAEGFVPVIRSFLEFSHAPLWLQGLLIDGVIAGVGGIMIFLPQLAFLFFFLSLLEDSGYMARVAFITDRLLARFGLSGKAFIPMILGFGCSVPALMACRGLDRRQRFATMIVVPFVSCGGRLPIYALFAAAFFARNQGLVVFSLYLLGIVVGLCSTLLLQPFLTHKQEKKTLFIMEMPPYRWPVWHCIRRRLWLRLKGFIVSAGSIILLASVVIWFLSNYNIRLQVVAEGSILQSLGKVFAPALKPLGFGQWQSTVALLNGFLNKEGVISSLSVLYGDVGGPGGLSLALQSIFTPLSAYTFMVFALLYTPCVATIAALRREAGSTWFALFCVVWQIVVAWLLAFLVYNGGRLLGLG
ncbi:MAG: ferrous iron transport protein B, partial [Clostridiales bacterium]|nr:ferrous iron transport protein B [Clostridiales bacterium]